MDTPEGMRVTRTSSRCGREEAESMSAVDGSIEQSLKEICGDDRVRTDRRERKMYSFDIGAMPKLVKPFVPAGVAGAVVRPRDEAQIVRLAKLAQSRSMRLVPRGWATSGCRSSATSQPGPPAT